MPVRCATSADAGTVATVLWEAFADDPFWSWVFADEGRRQVASRRWWDFYARAAIAGPALVLLDEGGGAAAVWVGADGAELLPEDDAAIGPLLAELLGHDHAVRVTTAFSVFEDEIPEHPLWYLAVLGTRVAGRRRGLARELVCAGIARADADGLPTGLESSDPANHGFYARLGYVPGRTFRPPGGAPPMTSMSRPARGGR